MSQIGKKPQRQNGGRPYESLTLKIVDRLLRTTMSHSAIADEFGVTQQWVSALAKRCRENNIQMHARPRGKNFRARA